MEDLRTASDDELLRLTPRRPRAFDEFYVRHETAVLGYFRRRTASADVALDLTAETFVRALAGVRRFKPVPASELLRALPAEQAEVRAPVFDEQPYSAIAEQLRCSPLAAPKRVSRGLATLRSIVVDEEAS